MKISGFTINILSGGITTLLCINKKLIVFRHDNSLPRNASNFVNLAWNGRCDMFFSDFSNLIHFYPTFDIPTHENSWHTKIFIPINIAWLSNCITIVQSLKSLKVFVYCVENKHAHIINFTAHNIASKKLFCKL